jgi:hypothetical protein
MKKGSVKIRFSIAAMMVLTLPAFAAAQRGGGARGGGAHFSAPVAAGRSGMMMSRVGSAPTRVYVRGGGPGGRGGAVIAGARSSGRVIRGGNRLNSGFNNGFNGFNNGFNGPTFQNVPGLGFDYPHLAAISGNRRGRGGRFGGGFPFGFGGFLLDSPGFIETVPSDSGVAGDEIASDPPDGDGTDVASAPPRRSRAPREASQPEAAPAPPQDVEQYVLVRQDGGLVFAVAYTWQNGTLRYITPDGLRHTIGRDALDLNATQQFNEQRGLNFQAPA